MKYLPEKEEKMDKLWSGRTNGLVDNHAEIFMNSVNEDKKLLNFDIIGNIAYSAALKKIGIINKNDFSLIIEGFRKLRVIFKDDNLLTDYEDVHSAVESELKKIIGDIAGKIHTGRSRNDQVILDEKLFLKNYIIELMSSLTKLKNNLVEIAEKNKDVIFPAYTHMQKAQPVLFAHYILSYFEKFYRDFKKLSECFEIMDIMPLGSGACSGSGYPIDTDYLMKLLRFKSLTNNSMDEVSSRDYIQDIVYSLSCIMIHLSRICEDFIIYNSSEFSFIDISDNFSTGSSIMPQKKNPDILELIRGKSAIVTGNLIQIIVLQKGLPSTYNRDLQEDKKILFQAAEETLKSTEIFADILKNINLNKKIIKANLEKGFLEATDVADYLVRKGESFRNAHHITGKLVNYCIKENKSFKELSRNELMMFSGLFDEDFQQKTDMKSCVDSKITFCGTNSRNVETKLKTAHNRLKAIEDEINKFKKRNTSAEELLEEIKNEMD
ncbi:MAG TPA: argininosuccinate lyase [Actinobacteria bacterium]|nr:argininosuccinate lyase [Actinomycetota bacterium]